MDSNQEGRDGSEPGRRPSALHLAPETEKQGSPLNKAVDPRKTSIASQGTGCSAVCVHAPPGMRTGIQSSCYKLLEISHEDFCALPYANQKQREGSSSHFCDTKHFTKVLFTNE